MPVMTLGKLCGAPINWTKPLRDGLAAAASHFGDGEVLDKDLECLKLLLSAPADRRDGAADETISAGFDDFSATLCTKLSGNGIQNPKVVSGHYDAVFLRIKVAISSQRESHLFGVGS